MFCLFKDKTLKQLEVKPEKLVQPSFDASVDSEVADGWRR